MERKHNYSVIVTCLDNGFDIRIYQGIYAFTQAEAIEKAKEMAKKEGHVKVEVFEIVPGAVKDNGLAPLYNFTVIIDYVYNGKNMTNVLNNVETDSEEQALTMAKDFILKQVPGSIIRNISIGSKTDIQ